MEEKVNHNHCDILWVEDFEGCNDSDSDSVTNDTSDRATFEKYLKKYFHSNYHFRVDIYKYFLKLLLHLQKENNLSKYSCAVLDINLTKSTWYNIKKAEDGIRPATEEEELNLIIDILRKNNVMVRDDHYLKCKKTEQGKTIEEYIFDSNGNKQIDKNLFYENAGYYLYLYLLQRGMPSERICVLSSNVGKDNLSEDWKKTFYSAGLIPPNYYDRMKIESEIKSKKDKSWLDKVFFSNGYYCFRSCIVAMSSCLLDMIEKGIKLRQVWSKEKDQEDVEAIIEHFKHILENVRNFSLRFSNKMEHNDYVNIIWQLVHPWEAKLEIRSEQTYDYAYYNLLKTTRNCLAHANSEKLPKIKLDLRITAFLFGLSLRGLFDFSNIDDSLKNSYGEYREWEKNLLNLLEEQEDNTTNKKVFPDEIVLESFKDINCRVSNNYNLNKDIPYLIRDFLGRKDNTINGDLSRSFLLRSFLHGINPIIFTFPPRFKGDKNLDVKVEIKLDKRKQDSEYNIAMEYLSKVRKTLQKSIENKN